MILKTAHDVAKILLAAEDNEITPIWYDGKLYYTDESAPEGSTWIADFSKGDKYDYIEEITKNIMETLKEINE